MRFITIKDVKLGNMRKAQDWTVTPGEHLRDGRVIAQCDKRIVEIDLNTGNGVLSSGKGGHQGFMMLMSIMGAVPIEVPADVLAKVREAVAGRTDFHGPVVVTALTHD